jgi:uncharacterized protein YmfQ (DUF2313 family)
MQVTYQAIHNHGTGHVKQFFIAFTGKAGWNVLIQNNKLKALKSCCPVNNFTGKWETF